MIFNMNEFLKAISNTLDTVEIDLFGIPTNHSKRIAYISIEIARNLNISDEEIFDLASFAIMHDNGASLKILQDDLKGDSKNRLNIIEGKKEHCIIGEYNLENYPFLTKQANVIKYHHEKYDGSGFFGIKGEDIPMFSQIISLADTLDLTFDINNTDKKIIKDFINNYTNKMFSRKITAAFNDISTKNSFWNNLKDNKIDESLEYTIPNIDNTLDYGEMRIITKTFTRIIDAKSRFTQTHSSELSNKAEKMAIYYKMDNKHATMLAIATDLHDLGKLVISNKILDKPGKLTKEEFDEVKKHPDITRNCLENIKGFEEITDWASNHHEKLNGTGYPNGMQGEDLDFNSRLIACLDIYQALREDRPYRQSMEHDKAMTILTNMAESGELDSKIVEDIGVVFECEQD